MSRTRLEWAQWMAEKGITVFIVEENSKRPLGGRSWLARQTTDPQQVADWFSEYPNCNYGVHLGEKYVAIDLDIGSGKNGIEVFDNICRENGIEDWLHNLNTLMTQTPSGGYHLFFKVPFPCANKNAFPNGIDVRGAVGYVVGPGSEIKETGTWEIIDPTAEIMDCPEFLLEYLQEPGTKDPNAHVPWIEWDLERNLEQAMEWAKNADPAVEGEEGDWSTYCLCCQLRDFCVSEGEAFRILNESGWNERCAPSWGDDELKLKIENSFKYAENRPGCNAVTYKETRFANGRPAGGYGITDAQVIELFSPPDQLKLVVDNTVKEKDSDIPTDVLDTEDPLAEFEPEDRLWYGFEDFIAIDKVREYIIKDWLIAHGVTALLARRGTGKSTIALDLGCHLATDRLWWGIPTMKNWCVIYICGEDDEGMILNARAWAQHHGETPRNDRFLIARGIIKMTDTAKLKIRLQEMVNWANGRRCVTILDTWARATSGYTANAQEDMDIAYTNAEKVAKALSGPMIACFHPPKDGRMTIRGSAVQEDASSGIWILEEDREGIKLTIDRAKGQGKGRFRNFKIVPLELTDGKLDAHGDPLEGIYVEKIGGTEDIGTAAYQEKLADAKNAWAGAVYGCSIFPMENNPFNTITVAAGNNGMGMARTKVSDMITNMWINQETDEHAENFVARYMIGLLLLGETNNITRTNKTVEGALNTHFFNSKDRTPVSLNDSTELIIENKETKTGTGMDQFVIRTKKRKKE